MTFNPAPKTLDEAKKLGIAPWDLEVVELSDYHVTVYRDRFPVTSGHLLFVPKFNTVPIIAQAMESALYHGDHLIRHGRCDAYNIGINMGTSAGQTVMYPHVHLIPRTQGDCEDPVGGIRGVIFGQANYKKPGYKNPTDK